MVLALPAPSVQAQVNDVTVTILTTNLADMEGQGEWSFSAWVEVGSRAFLFDTGWSPRNVLDNAEALGIDLSRAEDLILSHHHNDHTGGLLTLREELSKRNPKALSRIHVADGIFSHRPKPDGSERNQMASRRKALEASGAEFVVYEGSHEVAPGVWVTGPVPRKHKETNYPVGDAWLVEKQGEVVSDDVPESQSLVIVTENGPVVISGCGHAGLVNTLDHVGATISDASPHAAIGGFHLYEASDETLDWVSGALSSKELDIFVGSHCTGIDSVFHIRENTSMDRGRALVGAIGTRFVLGKGIVPGAVNR